MNDAEQLIDLYDNRAIGRRELLAGLAVIGFGGRPRPPAPSAFQARALNHVTLGVSDVGRSRAFYQRLLGLPIRDQGPDFCEFRLQNGFLGLYNDPDVHLGITSRLGSMGISRAPRSRPCGGCFRNRRRPSRTTTRSTSATPTAPRGS